MLVSNCCGAPARSLDDEDYELCSDCGEHCEYVEEDIDDEDLDAPWPLDHENDPLNYPI